MKMRAEKVMSRMALKVIGALAGSAVVASGCGIGSSATPPSASSFAEVYTRVIAPTCSNDFCHYNNVGIRYSALDMSSQTIAYWNLVQQPGLGPSCSEMGTRVVPGNPNAMREPFTPKISGLPGRRLTWLKMISKPSFSSNGRVKSLSPTLAPPEIKTTLAI